MRRVLTVVFLVLALAALVVQRIEGPARRGQPPTPPPIQSPSAAPKAPAPDDASATPPVEEMRPQHESDATLPLERVELADDRTSIVGITPDGAAVTVFELEDWRSWAQEHLEESLGGPARIGDQEIEQQAFDAFGAASLSPDGRRVALTTTSYAMLTTLSVVSLLDLDTRRHLAVAEPAFGDAEEFVWSPDGRHVAYALGTARAGGDGLRIDDLADLRVAHELDGEALIEASDGRLVDTDPRDWLPEIRQLAWFTPDELRFTTPGATEASDPLTWRLAVASGALEVLAGD